MQVKQIHELVNSITSEVLGKEEVVAEDLSNIVDVGNEIIGTDNVDNYVKKLVDRIGKTEFKAESYKGNAGKVLMTSWEYGSILQKVSADLPTAYENESWKLVDGQEYNPNIFYQPDVESKFFNNKITFEIPVSFAEKQVKGSFSSANELNGFLSMITTSVENSLTIKLDSLIMRTINNFIGSVLHTKNKNTAVNLLEMYNASAGETLTADKALLDPKFLRYANFIINSYINRMTRISTLFNNGGKERFTSKDKQHLILLSDFAESSNVFLQSDVYHNEFTSLQNFETVPYWQGTGTNYTFNDISSINVKANTGDVAPVAVNQTGILGVLFDRTALGVANLDKRVTTNYNPKAEFYTNFYKTDSSYFNDFNENFVVFYIADSVVGE